MDPTLRYSPRRIVAALIALALIATGCSADESSSDAPVESEAPLETPVQGEAAPTSEERGGEFDIDDRWNPLLPDLVAFVQETRQQPFRTVTSVEFVDKQALTAEIAATVTTLDDLPAEIAQTITAVDDVYRATGTTSVDFEMLDVQRALLREIFAFYDQQNRNIVFPSIDGEEAEELSMIDQVVLVHELTHALQASSRGSWSGPQILSPDLSRSLFEGEAEWVMNRYVDQLGNEERSEWTAFTNERRQPVDGVPDIVLSEFGQAYVLGSRFFAVQHAVGGIDGVEATVQARNVGEQMTLDPWAFDQEAEPDYFDYDNPEIPDIEPLASLGFNDLTFSATRFYQMFAAVMPGHQALHAARQIMSATRPTMWSDPSGRVCFAAHAVVASGEEDVVLDAITTWVAAAPDVRSSAPGIDGSLLVQGCAGDTVTEPATSALTVMYNAAFVIDVELWAFEHGLDTSVGFCLAWKLIEGQAPADPYAPRPLPVDLAVDDISPACL